MKQIYISLLLIAYMSNWLMGQVLILNNFQTGSNSCPLMEVRMTASNNDGFYTIAYCNHGNLLATNVYIELQLSDDAEIIESPYFVSSMQNNLYKIILPNTLASECLDFDIKINTSNPEATNCTKVRIYPDNPCQSMIDYYINNNLSVVMGNDDDDNNDDDNDDDNNTTINNVIQSQELRGRGTITPYGSGTVNSIFEDNVMLSGTPTWIWDSLINTNTITSRPNSTNNNTPTLSTFNTNSAKGAGGEEQNDDLALTISKLVWAEYCKNSSITTPSTINAMLGDRIPFVGVINGFSTISNTIINSENENNTNLGQNNIENNLQSPLEVAIYPNPFNTQTTIEIIGDFENRTFALLDATGKTIKNISFQTSKITLQKENLAAGLYFYQIINKGQLEQVGKLIVH